MPKNTPFLGIALASVLILGAGCHSEVTNTNRTVNAVTNTPPTNSRTTGTFSTTPLGPAAATVTITNTGPDRPTVTIKLGERVEFRNGDTVAHWIASTPHPTHTDLPGFEKNIPAGGTYSYTFTRPGTFTYYDNSAPTDIQFTGRVTVQ